MRHLYNIFTIFAISLLHCNAQISIKTIEQKQPEAQIKPPVPPYDSIEPFLGHGAYYRIHWRVAADKKCAADDFYKRYVGLQIYYPLYSNEFDKNSTFMFSDTSNLKFLSWKDVGDKYFTIQNIYPQFEKSAHFDKVRKIRLNIPKNVHSNLLFELKDNKTNEIVFVTELDVSKRFVFVPYFLKIQQTLKDRTLVAVKYISTRAYPDVTKIINIEENTEWKGEFTLLRSESFYKYNQVDTDEKIIPVYILRNNTTAFILYENSQYGTPVLSEVIKFKDELQIQAQKQKQSETARVNALIKKYGSEYGKLIAKNQVKIGMTKEMCQEAWGTTFDIKKFTDKERQKELWRYEGRGKLIFENGKLINILE